MPAAIVRTSDVSCDLIGIAPFVWRAERARAEGLSVGQGVVLGRVSQRGGVGASSTSTS